MSIKIHSITIRFQKVSNVLMCCYSDLGNCPSLVSETGELDDV